MFLGLYTKIGKKILADGPKQILKIVCFFFSSAKKCRLKKNDAYTGNFVCKGPRHF